MKSNFKKVCWHPGSERLCNRLGPVTCQLDGVCDGQLVLTSYLFPGCFVQASIQSADGSSSTSEADLASAKACGCSA